MQGYLSHFSSSKAYPLVHWPRADAVNSVAKIGWCTTVSLAVDLILFVTDTWFCRACASVAGSDLWSREHETSFPTFFSFLILCFFLFFSIIDGGRNFFSLLLLFI